MFALVFGGAVCAILVRPALPQDYLSADSKTVVTLSMGLVATMAALVLGLLISSAKGFYDAQSGALTQMSARVILLDRILPHYGPEAKEARDLLHSRVADSIDRMWPQEHTPRSFRSWQRRPPARKLSLTKFRHCHRKIDRQSWLKAQALSMLVDLIQTHWLMYEQGADSVSGPMLAILVFWLVTIFTSFGLFAPRNPAVIATLFAGGCQFLARSS